MVSLILSKARQLALKIASYGLMHLVVAIAVAFAITKDIRLALAVGMIEPFFQTIAYTLHDRIWHVVEKRRMESGLKEAAEAFTSRLSVMSPEEQLRSHGECPSGHSHALPRSLKQIAVKTVTYSIMHFAVAVAVAYALIGDIRAALAIGLIEPLVQTVFFTLHDRIWTRLEYNRLKASSRSAHHEAGI